MESGLKIVLDSIGKGDIAPAYLIYGDEAYLVKEAADRIIGGIFPQGVQDLNLFRMDGERIDVESICETIRTPPLIPGKKVIVIKNTTLLSSRFSAADYLGQVVQNLKGDPCRAARAFMNFLSLMDWSLDEMIDGGWERVSREEWQRLSDGVEGAGGLQWLPEIIELCVRKGMADRPAPQETAHLESILREGLSGGISLILTAEAVDKRKRIFKTIADVGVVLHFPKAAKESQQKTILSGVAKEYLATKGKRLAPEAFRALGERAGFDLQEAFAALDKLVTYVGEHKELIEKSDVETAIGRTKEEKVFGLTDAIVEGDLEKGLLILHRLVAQGAHPLMILAMIIREVRLLIQGKMIIASDMIDSFNPRTEYAVFQRNIYPLIKEASKRYELGKGSLFSQHPYAIYNALRNSTRFSYEKLMQFMDKLVAIDIALKTSGTEPRLLLERLLVDLCKG